jgi:cytochrome c-type biogenesis protein
MVDLKEHGATEPRMKRAPSTDRRFGRMLIVLVLLFGGAFGLLLLTTIGDSPSTEGGDDVTILSQTEVVDTLLRSHETNAYLIEVLYTPDWYYDWSGRAAPSVEEPTLAYLVFETIHEGELTPQLPSLTLFSDFGPIQAAPADVVTTSSHHRVTQVLLPAQDAEGRDLLDGERGAMTIELRWQMDVNELSWDLPLPHGLGTIDIDTDTESGGGLFGSGRLSWPALAAIFAGMMTALSPCLLFLAVYYSAVLSGVTVSDEKATAQAKRKLFATSASFVVGFTAIYTLGGIAAGYVGASLSRLDLVNVWSRPISIVAGLLVIYMGLRTAAQANVPMVCKVPALNRKAREGGSAMLMGSTFAVGCLSCFSATVLSALLLYAGATGSPLTGGLIMMIFSLGVGVIFLLAAWLLAHAAPLMTWLEKARPWIGGVSAVVMIGFGLLMVTYKFHIWTGALFRFWS